MKYHDSRGSMHGRNGENSTLIKNGGYEMQKIHQEIFVQALSPTPL